MCFAERRDHEDLEPMPRVALSMRTFIHMPQTWIHYRLRPGSRTTDGATPASLRESWEAALPLSVPALTWAYLRRGQFRRCLQMHALLRED